MYSYEKVKKEHGNSVSQTIDGPIMFFDHFDLWDMGLGLSIILIFGVIMYSWWTMIVLLLVTLGIVPVIKKNNHRGVFLHWFYKKLGLTLPGFLNPKWKGRMSD